MIPDRNKRDASFKEFEASIAAIIYNDIVNSVIKVTTMKKIRHEILALAKVLQLEPLQSDYIRAECVDLYRKIVKMTLLDVKKAKKIENYAEKQEKLSDIVYEAIRKTVIYDKILKKAVRNVTSRADQAENIEKLRSDMKKSRESGSYSPFWLCSYHYNCASDHAELQGRMYYDADYVRYIQNADIIAKVQKYIYNHSLKSVQEVTGKPYYLITRPYCRHFLTNVTIAETLTSSAKALVRNKNLIVKEHYLTESERIRQEYLTRQDINMRLYKLMPCKALTTAMKEDRYLVKKWTATVLLENKGARN